MTGKNDAIGDVNQSNGELTTMEELDPIALPSTSQTRTSGPQAFCDRRLEQIEPLSIPTPVVTMLSTLLAMRQCTF
jgi:hypothetical protein